MKNWKKKLPDGRTLGICDPRTPEMVIKRQKLLTFMHELSNDNPGEAYVLLTVCASHIAEAVGLEVGILKEGRPQ